MYAVKEIPGKGLGLVATTLILKGTRILSEAPLFRVPQFSTSKIQAIKSLSKIVSALSAEDQQAFLLLHNSFEDNKNRALSIVRTNSLPLGYNASEGGIFIEASRINHACLPNAQNNWNESLQRLTIHATRDIDIDEEITIMYLAERKNRAARQQKLLKNFRFTCSCRLCSLPPSSQLSSDARLDEISRLDDLIGNETQAVRAPLQALQRIHKLLKLCEEEGLADGDVPRAYYDAFQLAVFNSDLARASIFANRAAVTRTTFEGDDSPEVRKLRHLSEDPTGHPCCGFSPCWSTRV